MNSVGQPIERFWKAFERLAAKAKVWFIRADTRSCPNCGDGNRALETPRYFLSIGSFSEDVISASAEVNKDFSTVND